MPYEISWEPVGVLFRFSGVVSDEDLVASNEEVYTHPLFPAMTYQIVDFSPIEEFAVSSATVRAVAESDLRAAQANPNVKVAIITSAILMRGMSNMYALTHESKGGTWTVEIFEREKEARAWATTSSQRAGQDE